MKSETLRYSFPCIISRIAACKDVTDTAASNPAASDMAPKVEAHMQHVSPSLARKLAEINGKLIKLYIPVIFRILPYMCVGRL